MEYAVALSAAQGNWQQRFRDLKFLKSNILHYILNVNTIVSNIPQKPKALKKILIKQQNSLLFLTPYTHCKNFAALFFRCRPPGSRRSLFPRIHINPVDFEDCVFQDSGPMLSDFPSFYLTIPHLHNPRLHLTDDLYQKGRLVIFDKSSITYPSKTHKRSTFFGETNRCGFFIKESFQKEDS
jgi:hypothetical protein